MKKMLAISMVLFIVLSGTALATDILTVLVIPTHGVEMDVDYMQCEYTGQPELYIAHSHCTGRTFLYDRTAKAWVFRDIHWGSLEVNSNEYTSYTDFELVNGHEYVFMMFIDEVHPDYVVQAIALATVRADCTTKAEPSEKK